MESPSLHNLPSELVQTICANFCQQYKLHLPPEEPSMIESCQKGEHRNTRALNSLGKTCRRLHRIVNPILYHDYVSATRKIKTNCLFLRTIISNPNLADMVRRIVVDARLFNDGCLGEEYWPLVDWVLQSDTPASNSSSDSRVQSYGRSSIGELFHMVLHRLPNMQHLYLQADMFVEYGTFFVSADNLLFMKELHLNWYNMVTSLTDPFKSSGLAKFVWLLEQMPNLENLVLERMPFTQCELSFRDLRRLELRDCNLYHARLDIITSRSPKLETFILHVRPRDSVLVFHSDRLSYPREIVRSLLSCKDTLRHLEVQCVRNWDGNDPITMMTSLKEFQVLETVFLDAGCLTNFHRVEAKLPRSRDTEHRTSSLVHLFPTSIRIVVIDGYAPTFFEHTLELILEVGKGSFPHLHEFTYLDPFKNLTSEEINTLTESMKSVGVLFRVSEESKFYNPTSPQAYWVRF